MGLTHLGSLELSGNLEVAGTETVTGGVTYAGNVTLGDATSDVITVTGGLVATSTVVENATTATSGAGAVAVTGRIHEVTTTGTDALTLADGVEGQRLSVVMVVDGGDATITPTNLAGTATTITLDAVGDAVELLFTAGTWFVVGSNGATLA